jgi:hypothetical protein
VILQQREYGMPELNKNNEKIMELLEADILEDISPNVYICYTDAAIKSMENPEVYSYNPEYCGLVKDKVVCLR